MVKKCSMNWIINLGLPMKNYPLNWKQIEVKKSYKYIGRNKLSELTPLLASSLMKGQKEIE